MRVVLGMSLLLIPLAVGCGGEKGDNGYTSILGGDGSGGNTHTHISHSTCQDLDLRGVVDRLDHVTSSSPDVVDLDGQCLEAISQVMGEVLSIRFRAPAGADEVPAYHIQLYLIPPDEDATLFVGPPDQLSKTQCLDVPAGSVCGHLDDNTFDDASDDVDYRGKTGSLSLEITDEAGDGIYIYQGDFAMVAYAINSDVTPEAFDLPTVLLEGTFHWRHPDGVW